jgi:uncharacterized damage-inducible protein DinB
MCAQSLQTGSFEVGNIADQIERTFEGDAWHGSSISEVLSSVCAEEAAARPLPAVHTIWEIVLHMSVWQRTVRERLQGRPIRPLSDEEDWPTVAEVSDSAWAEAVRELGSEYELLREEARRWNDRNLGERVEGQRYTVYQMLHGVVQHGLYHAGQIAVLKKASL